MPERLINMITTADLLKRAKKLSLNAPLSTDEKNRALKAMASSLVANSEEILAANSIDVEKAKETVSEVMIDRLRLNKERIEAMAKGILEVANLPDPVGKTLAETKHNNGIVILKTSIPFGVVAIIYESRPNVTSDAAALAFKSGNVCVLRGGKEAYNSAYAIVKALKKGLKESNINEDYINLIEDTTRNSANERMTAVGFVDLLIPRGGKGLIKNVVENAKMPVIETGAGNCHLYVDKDADIDMAVKVASNAKNQRPSVCNAIETLLVHSSVADEFLLKFAKESEKYNLEIRGCENTRKILTDALCATEEDYATEYDDYIVAVKVVENVEEAVVQFTKGLLTKDNIWSYENEWRILIKAKDVPDIPMTHISCVYLGASISDENRNAILQIAKEKNYKVKQMVVDRGAYALHAEDVEF